MHEKFFIGPNHLYSNDKLGNSYYYIGTVGNIDMDNLLSPTVIISEDTPLNIQWRCYNPKMNIYRTQGSSTILHDKKSYKISLEMPFKNPDYSSDQLIEGHPNETFIFIKIIRRDLGIYGFSKAVAPISQKPQVD